MDLFALKSGQFYLKKTEDKVEKVNIDKASVYPSLDKVVALKEMAKEQGLDNFKAIKLTLLENEISIF